MKIDQLQHAFESLGSNIANGPIVPDVTAEEIRGYLASRYSFGKKIALDDVIADVETMLGKWQVQVTHPRYFGLFNPSVTLASVVADTLVAMYNPQLANWRTSPAANEIERYTLAWLAGKFGMPEDSIASFTSGGMEANLSAVVVALTRAFPEYGVGGLRCIERTPAIYLTEQAHHGFNKIAHMTGLGRGCLRTIPTDHRFKMNLEELEKRVVDDRAQGFFPFMVVGNAGTTAAGIIDPLPEIGHFCKDEGLWFHIDAAWGGAAIVSPGLRQHLTGTEVADSITCDAHKWFSVPMGCGMFFCRNRESVEQAFRAEVSYMPGKSAGLAGDVSMTFDPFTASFQWSRRFIGLKLFMALAEQGEAGYVDMIDRQTLMGQLLREQLAAAGWRIVNATPLPLVCFTRDGLVPSEMLAILRERQIAWMSEAQLDGIPVLRACITSFKTSKEDIHFVVEKLNSIFAEMVCEREISTTSVSVEKPHAESEIRIVL